MLVFGQIEPMGMGNLVPLPKKTAKGLQGAVYNQFAERMYRLLPHRSMPNPTQIANLGVPIRFLNSYIDPADDRIRFTAITENGRFLSDAGRAQYVRYFNPARNDYENREGFEQGYVVDHTVLPHFLVHSPSTEPTVIATFTLPDGNKAVGAGALGDGSTGTIVPLLQYKPKVRRLSDVDAGTAEVVVWEDTDYRYRLDPPYRVIICYYVDTPKEAILLPATISRDTFTRQKFYVQIFQRNIPLEIQRNVSGIAIIVLWGDQARIVGSLPIVFPLAGTYYANEEILAIRPPFNFHTANLPYNPRAIKTVGNRTFYFYPNEVRVSAIGRMWDIPDDLSPIGVAGGGGIIDVPNALDIISFGSQYLLFTKQGVYRLFEPSDGEWVSALLPFPPPRLASSSALFPTPIETTPNGVMYYGGMWFEIAGTNEAINITHLPLTLLPLLKISGSEPSIAIDTEGKVYLILDEAFYEVETGGGRDVVAINGRFFYARGTSIYEIDPFAPV